MSKELDGLSKILDSNKPLPEYKTNDKQGIIYVGGGKYWVGIVTGIRLLRRWGCKLPVEIWFRGSCETVDVDDILDLGDVKLFDIDKMSTQLRDNRIPSGNVDKGGWEAKLYAMTHTELGRVLYLDADAYCVDDPEFAFETLDRKPFVFWNDLASHSHDVKWQHVYPKGENFKPLVQGGQLFIDRVKGWKLVHLAHYMCQNSKYYFQYMYGDQDTWRVALAIMEKEFKEKLYCNLGIADWVKKAFVCRYIGEPLVVHRCRSKLFEPIYIPERKVDYSNPQYYLPNELDVFEEFAEVMNKRNPEASRVFGGIYDRRLWGRGSGAGSSEGEAKAYIDIVNKLIADEHWSTVVDVGCGDGYIASELKVTNYVGYDCCPIVVRQTSKKYYKLKFLPLDIYRNYDKIQVGDCLLCKDVLQHWPNEYVRKWLRALIASKKWKTILLCNDREQLKDSQDTYLGGYRALDNTMHPLSPFKFKCVAEWEGKAIYRLDLAKD